MQPVSRSDIIRTTYSVTDSENRVLPPRLPFLHTLVFEIPTEALHVLHWVLVLAMHSLRSINWKGKYTCI